MVSLNPAQKFRSNLSLRRLAVGLVLALALHLLLLVLANTLRIAVAPNKPTEIIQISPKELEKIKQTLAQDQELPALLEQELREEFKTKEAPKNAQHIGKFNQSVPEQTVAGAQRDAPQTAQTKQRRQTETKKQQKPIQLSDLGTGFSLPRPIPEEQRKAEVGPQDRDFRARGLDDPKLKRGRDNLLNAVESEYYSFFLRFEEPIIRNWFFNMRSREGEMLGELAAKGVRAGTELPCVVEFTIDRKGEFLNVIVVTSSGSRVIDSATRAAVTKLERLPNPPVGLFKGGPTFTYKLRFTVEVQNTPTVAEPELQWY